LKEAELQKIREGAPTSERWRATFLVEKSGFQPFVTEEASGTLKSWLI
jgi:hypothetical protein